MKYAYNLIRFKSNALFGWKNPWWMGTSARDVRVGTWDGTAARSSGAYNGYGTVRYGMVRYGTVRYGTVRYGHV